MKGRDVNFEMYEIVSSGISNRGGQFAIVDVDTSDGRDPVLTYSMFQEGTIQEQGSLTILSNGGMSHKVLMRDEAKMLDYRDCIRNITEPTVAGPVIGGLDAF